MFEETMPAELPTQAITASNDRWLVECLTLAAFVALASSQIMGQNVLLALF